MHPPSQGDETGADDNAVATVFLEMPLLLPWGGPEGLRPSSAPPEKAILPPSTCPAPAQIPAERAEKGRCRPEKWDFRGGEVPSTPPPVELVAEGDPQTPYR